MRVFYFLILCGFLFSCDKNKDFPKYTSLYHIDGNDTISAVHIPNSFTPDGDVFNDGFKIIINGIDSANIIIYNRNGGEIYSSSFVDVYGWDGTYKGVSAENGNYHFTLNAKDSTGYKYYYQGVLELLR